MVYGKIAEVRRLAGMRPQKAYNVSIGTGDGVETEFELIYVGYNEGFLLDQDQQTVVNPTLALGITDITVYADDVPVTVSSVDNEKGTVTLSSAPSDTAVITADFWHSLVSDEMVIDVMQTSEERVQDFIDGTLDTATAKTYYYDGDGYEDEFWMKDKDVTSITSVTVGGGTKTANVDYYTYYYDTARTRIAYIKFKTPPSASTLQNIVVVVEHGQSKYSLVRLSNLIAGKMLLAELPDSAIVGEFKKGSQSSGKVPTSSRLRMINSEIAGILEHYDRRDILGV